MRAGYELYRQLEKVFEKAVDNTIPCVLSFGYTRYTTRRQNVEGNSKPGRVGDIPLCSGIFIFWQRGRGNVGNSEYIQTIRTVEDMEPVARDIVSQYCAENDLNEKDIPPTVWDDIIDELYLTLFKPCNRLLKTESNINNEYDKGKVMYVYKYIYKRLCNNHCQEVLQKGFLDMTGINKQTLYNWSSDKLSLEGLDLQQKIMEDNEQSLFSLMKDRRYNPMKLLPKLNKVHGWNMPGVRADADKRQALSAQELPKLDGMQELKGIDGGESP